MKGARLSKKQKGFVKDYIKTGNGVKSALNNYDTKDYNTANQIAIENLQKPTVQNAIKSIADSIPDDLLIKKHIQLLNKEEVVTKNNMTTGEVDVKKTGQIDAQAVKAGLDMAYKLKGAYAADKTDITSQGEKIIIMPAELIKKNDSPSSTK